MRKLTTTSPVALPLTTTFGPTQVRIGIAPAWLLRRNGQDYLLCRLRLEFRGRHDSIHADWTGVLILMMLCLSTGAKAGIGVLAAVAALMAFIAVVLLMMMTRM